MERHLTMLPSDYIARNVRVTPFHFEPVDHYLDLYPKMIDVLSYSSDYPHIEGGQHSAQIYNDCTERLGVEIAERFFVRNGEWLLPDL